jgi:hypothetical protein
VVAVNIEEFVEIITLWLICSYVLFQIKAVALFRWLFSCVRMARGLLILGGIARMSGYFDSPTHDRRVIKIVTVGEDLNIM